MIDQFRDVISECFNCRSGSIQMREMVAMWQSCSTDWNKTCPNADFVSDIGSRKCGSNWQRGWIHRNLPPLSKNSKNGKQTIAHNKGRKPLPLLILLNFPVESHRTLRQSESWPETESKWRESQAKPGKSINLAQSGPWITDFVPAIPIAQDIDLCVRIPVAKLIRFSRKTSERMKRSPSRSEQRFEFSVHLAGWGLSESVRNHTKAH
jgi:hypothetical protein